MTGRSLAVAACFAFLNILDPFSAASDPAHVWDEAVLILDEIRSETSIDMGFAGLEAYQRTDIIFEEITEGDLKRFVSFLSVFQEETGKYPPGFFAKGELTKVVFVKKLFYESQPAQGVYRFPEAVMYFDIYRDFGNEPAQRHGIHHEVFHMIDISLRRRFNLGEAQVLVELKEGSERLGMMKDPYGWEALNESGFKYERVGRWHKGRNELNFFAPPKAGFATDYGFVSMEEDMAEVYACLFIESENRLLHQWAQKDRILAAKIQKMKTMLQLFSPLIDKHFWEDPI